MAFQVLTVACSGEGPALGQQGEVYSCILEEAEWTCAGAIYIPDGAQR
jgi:hypothetical protein